MSKAEKQARSSSPVTAAASIQCTPLTINFTHKRTEVRQYLTEETVPHWPKFA